MRGCSFSGNSVSSVKAIASEIIVYGDTVFSDNHALSGTAFILAKNSVIQLLENQSIVFQTNYATNYGGAFYISTEEEYVKGLTPPDFLLGGEPSLLATKTNCFLKVVGDRSKSRLTFANNSADKGGDVLFGGLVALGYDGDWNCLLSFKNISDMSQQSGLSLISSNPSRVCLCHNETQPDCLSVTGSETYNIYPGQSITLPAAVVGQDFGTMTGVVIAEFLKSHSYTTCYVGIEPEQRSKIVTHNGTCSNLPFTIYSNSENCKTILVLKTDNREVVKPMTTDDNHKINNTWAILTQEPNYLNLISQFIPQFVICDLRKIDFILTDVYNKMAEDTIDNFLKFTPETIEYNTNYTCSDIYGTIIHNKLIFPTIHCISQLHLTHAHLALVLLHMHHTNVTVLKFYALFQM